MDVLRRRAEQHLGQSANLNVTANPLIGLVFGARALGRFLLLRASGGAVAFVLWCWPGGASSPLVLRLTMSAWGGLAASVLGAMLLQGVYGSGEGVSKLFWPNVLHATLYSRYGRSLGVRLVLVIVALFVFSYILVNLQEEGRRASVRASVTWGVVAAALAATWAAADHAGQGIQVPLSLASDTIHLSSVALWLGGLTMLATIVLQKAPHAEGKLVTIPLVARGARRRTTRCAPSSASRRSRSAAWASSC